MGFFDLIPVFFYCMIIFWPITLGFAVCGIILGLVSAKSLARKTGTALAIVLGAVACYFVPLWIGQAMFSPEEGLGILAFAWAGGGGAFIGYCLPFLFPVLRRVRVTVDKVDGKKS